MTRLLTAAAFSLMCLAGIWSPAHAAAGAEARIADITYTLVDLDLGDGIAPAMSFVNDPVTNRFRTELTADVANAAVFLASDEASWITGTTIYVDGAEANKGYPDLGALIRGG